MIKSAFSRRIGREASFDSNGAVWFRNSEFKGSQDEWMKVLDKKIHAVLDAVKANGKDVFRIVTSLEPYRYLTESSFQKSTSMPIDVNPDLTLYGYKEPMTDLICFQDKNNTSVGWIQCYDMASYAFENFSTKSDKGQDIYV